MSDTPETEKLRECIVAQYKEDECTGTAMGNLLGALPDIESLERQRDAYAETLRAMAETDADWAFIREQHPELVNADVMHGAKDADLD